MDKYSVTSDELEALKEAFQLYDHDHDGTIAVDDFGRILASLKIAADPTEIERIAASVDCNADHVVDFDEFVKAMVKFMPQLISTPPSMNDGRSSTRRWTSRRQVSSHEDDELLACFKAFDKNNDGLISQQELEEIMQNLGERLTEKDIRDMIEEADTNHDGVIDFEEFKKLLPSK